MSQTSKQSVIYFIADLHLAENRPDITACFLSFLANDAINAKQLYILGDLFESWIGDDDDSAWLVELTTALHTLAISGTELLYLHGNRDFLLGNRYARASGMKLLPEVCPIELFGQPAVVMHGDTLCTRDIGYQKFRKKSRSWWWQLIVKSLPLVLRRRMAANYRTRSAAATAMKSQEIMDVTPEEVVICLEKYHTQLLIHGHTHRPDVHHIQANGHDAQRIVLGDWYQQGAWLKVTPDDMILLNQSFSSASR